MKFENSLKEEKHWEKYFTEFTIDSLINLSEGKSLEPFLDRFILVEELPN